MLARLKEHWDTLLWIAGGASVVASAASVAFFAFSIDAGIVDMQEQDDRWLQLDQDQTAEIIAAVEEVRTAQGLILGRLDGTGCEVLYLIGVRDGRALEVGP